MAAAATPKMLECGGKIVDLSSPRVMGILNITPDSFSDGGEFFRFDAALRHARDMVEAGAAIIDVGGESSRPGADPVPLEEELRRVVPVVEALAPELPVPLSVDTSKPEVMRAAARAGAGLINDVNAFRAEGALQAAAACGLPLCIMHMLGNPRTMQADPCYDNVVRDVRAFLEARLLAGDQAGVPRERMIVDPGFGFGKNDAHNARLLRNLHCFTDLGVPLLVGLSRKSFLGRVTGRGAGERLAASVAAAALAVVGGASIVRAHDVAATVDAVALAHFVDGQPREQAPAP